MIKNIVFDIGNVLVAFRWREMMAEMNLSKEAQDQFEVYVFGSKWWHKLDHGTIEEDEAVEILRNENRDYKEAFEMVWSNRDQLVRPYPYATPWIQELKDRGYHVYLLSNYPSKLFTMHEEKGAFPFMELVDGRVVSAFVKKIKPDADIYECLMEKYDLKASECVFIDDRPENVEGALQVGMKGIILESYKQAKEQLEKILAE